MLESSKAVVVAALCLSVCERKTVYAEREKEGSNADVTHGSTRLSCLPPFHKQLPAPAASSATARAVTTTPTAGGISAEGREQAEAERERQRAINLSDARRNARAERARRQGSQVSERAAGVRPVVV